MNSKIIRNFDDFLNEEEEFDLYEESDLDLYDELDEELDSEYEDLDESYEDDFYSEEDYDFEDELDESEYYGELSETKKPIAKAITAKKPGPGGIVDKAAPAKFKFRANMAPRFIMASLKGTGAVKAAGAAATPSNLGYKKGAKSIDLLPATTLDFLRMTAQINPGKLDPASYKKVVRNLLSMHQEKIGNMPAPKKPGKLDPKFRQTWIDAKKAKKSTFMFNGKKFATANGKAVK